MRNEQLNLSPELADSLHDCLTKPIEWFKQFGKVHETDDGPAIFDDRGAGILAVGHLDWVHFNPEPVYQGNSISQCPQLDDRLGVWVLLYLLPHLDPTLAFDLLLCDSEEVGRSTGDQHPLALNKAMTLGYQWGFEFDRAGTDVVTYGYSDQKWDAEMTKIAPVGRGAFSDISSLTHYGCKMVNLGVGYHRQHTHECFADLSETMQMATSFVNWAYDARYKTFPHKQPMSYDQAYPSLDSAVCGCCHNPIEEDQLLCYDCQYDFLAEQWEDSGQY